MRRPHQPRLTQLLERGLLDGLFLADIVGAYDVYQRSLDLTLREAIQLPLGDPVPLVAAMAAVTQHLGFGVTVKVADELVRWFVETGTDGFNLARTVTPECFEDIVEFIVPELQDRGAYKTAYAPGTLRDKLFGHGPRPVGARAMPTLSVCWQTEAGLERAPYSPTL